MSKMIRSENLKLRLCVHAMLLLGAFEQSAHLRDKCGVQGVNVFVGDLVLLNLLHGDGLADLSKCESSSSPFTT